MKQLSNINYQHSLNTLKEKIKTARLKAVLAVNAQLLAIYWEIGKVIIDQQKEAGWGTKIIDRLAADLKIEFPDETGFSIRNLKYMRAFAEAYPDFPFQSTIVPLIDEKRPVKKKSEIVQATPAQTEGILNTPIVQAALAQLSWYHHITLLDKVKDWHERIFYIRKTIENGWSRQIMVLQIEKQLYQRQGKTINNFDAIIPSHDSDLAQETFKSPYIFDFLMLSEDAKEKDLERGLILHLQKFMLELGRGFAYVGNQYNLRVGDDEYFLDLLFYNTNLHCYVLFELKIGDFKPEYAGKLNFYINTVDEKIKSKNDRQTVGILLCKTPNKTVVEYSLKGIKTPLGVAEYEFAKTIPNQIKRELPTIEELEAELEKEYEELKSPTQKKFDALKEKLTNLKGHNEIKQKVSAEIIKNLCEKSFSQLFDALLTRLHELDEYFYSATPEYQGLLASFKEKENIAKEWKDEDFVNRHMEAYFSYKLDGYKNAGVKSFNIWVQLTLYISNYWYGFSIMGYKNNQVFLKNMYHEQLTQENIQTITDSTIDYISDEIEQQLLYIEQRHK